MLALREQISKQGDRTGRAVAAAVWSVPSPAPPACLREADSAPLSALAGEALETRFRCWRGASGRRYVFSIYACHSCPAYDHAVILIAAREADGRRKVLFIGDTGSFPDVALAGAAVRWKAADGEIEFHIHLLANSPAERNALIADLSHAPRS